jgi:chromosome segregation ATPase
MYEIAAALKEIKDRINRDEAQMSEYTDGLHSESTENINESQSTIVDLEIANAELEEDLSEAESTIVDLEIANAELENDLSEAESTIVDLEIEVAELKNIINKEG